MAVTEGSGTTPPELMRGVSGGVILGLPLIYTQEVWMLGATINPLGIVALLIVSFFLNLLLSRYVGFEDEEVRPLANAIQGLGVSIVLSAGLLFLLERVTVDMASENILGVIALCSLPVSLGFALGNALAPADGGEGADRIAAAGGQFLVGAGGALILSLNIAPTEEPVLMAYQLEVPNLISLVILSLLLSYLIVFYAEFRGKDLRLETRGSAMAAVAETILVYLIALLVAGGLLISFAQTDRLDVTLFTSTLVLGFPAAMGAALGRALL
ncbi:MAG: TIGR02587 family membrane protein [Actinobacteria bacterium]|nr:TIGR02587 family membrane protein [Actinomycetota bacterium]